MVAVEWKNKDARAKGKDLACFRVDNSESRLSWEHCKSKSYYDMLWTAPHRVRDYVFDTTFATIHQSHSPSTAQKELYTLSKTLITVPKQKHWYFPRPFKLPRITDKVRTDEANPIWSLRMMIIHHDILYCSRNINNEEKDWKKRQVVVIQLQTQNAKKRVDDNLQFGFSSGLK